MADLPELDLSSSSNNLARDAENVRRVELWLGERVARTDASRMLGLIPAGPGAQPLLNGSLPKLLDDAEGIGRRAELVLGLNDDVAPPPVLDRLAERADIVHLWTAPKSAPDDPAASFTDPARTVPGTLASFGATERHRVCLLHQTPSPYSSGTVRVQLDGFALLLRSASEGWTPPELAFKCDAESLFLRGPRAEERDTPPDDASNGFEPIERLLADDPAVDFVGARVVHAVFLPAAAAGVSCPDWSARLPATHLYQNLVNGLDGFEVLQGPGFAGRALPFLAVGYVTLRFCCGAFAEDYATQVVANASGHAHRVAFESLVTNRCPPAEDVDATLSQLARWVAFGRNVRDRYRTRYLTPSGAQWRQAARRCRADPRANPLLFAQSIGWWVRAAWRSRKLGREPAWGDTLRDRIVEPSRSR